MRAFRIGRGGMQAGKEKAAILGAIRAGGSHVPAARVRPVGEFIWFVDQAAATGGTSGDDAHESGCTSV